MSEMSMLRSRRLLNYVSPTAHLLEPVGNFVRIDRQSVFIRLVVIVGPAGKIHDHDIFAADVLVRMPDTCRDIDELSAILRKNDLGNETARRRVASIIKEYEQKFTRENAVAIVMQLVHAPAFDHSGTERESVGEDEWIGMPLPSRIEHLEHRSALIDMSSEVARGDARRQRANPVAFGCSRGLIANA